MRWPVCTLMTPNNTRFAFLPVIATTPCSPLADHALRSTGNSRSMVSSSKSKTAEGGILLSFRIIAPFFAPGSDPFLHIHNGGVYNAALFASCVFARYPHECRNDRVDLNAEPAMQPSIR